jgi:hypothetical protein
MISLHETEHEVLIDWGTFVEFHLGKLFGRKCMKSHLFRFSVFVINRNLLYFVTSICVAPNSPVLSISLTAYNDFDYVNGKR